MVEHSRQIQGVLEVLCIGVKYSLHSTLALNSMHSTLAFVLCIQLKAMDDNVPKWCHNGPNVIDGLKATIGGHKARQQIGGHKARQQPP